MGTTRSVFTAAPRVGGTPDQLAAQQGWGVAQDALTVVAAICAIVLIRRVTGRQEQKRSRVEAYGSAVAAAG